MKTCSLFAVLYNYALTTLNDLTMDRYNLDAAIVTQIIGELDDIRM